MGKIVAYVAAAAVCLGIGALVAGLSVWYAHPDIMRAQKFSESRYAQCQLQSTAVGDVQGTLYLEQLRPNSPVLITGAILGLSEGLHGFHVHQWGVQGAENKCIDAGGHYNPLGYKHSAPSSTERHVGDLGNVMALQVDVSPANTNTDVGIEDNTLTMWGQYSIVGRAIVVHAGEDDLGKGGNDESLKTGNAGKRVACCTIYLTSKPVN